MKRANLETGVSGKQSIPDFLKKKHFLPLMRSRTCAYEWVRNVCFLEDLVYFVFLKQPIWDSSFCLCTVNTVWGTHKRSAFHHIGPSQIICMANQLTDFYVMGQYWLLCAIWYHLYNLKNVENIHGRVLRLELQLY